MNDPANLAIDSKRRLTILQQSPLDDQDLASTPAKAAPVEQKWVPSRFNVRATADGGRLILWNTLSNSISAFKKEQVPQVMPLLKAAGFSSEPTGLAGYLAERGFIVRRGTDEYRKFLHAFGQQHYRTDRLELFVLSSEDCNFRCTYCYEEFARGTMLPAVRRGIKRLVEDRIKRLQVLDVRWFGGEPLYGWAAVEELAPFFSDIARDHDVAYMNNMTTNGYLMTPDVVDKLLSWRINDFQVTLDGVPDTHDCSRPARDGQGTFAVIFDNLRAMARRPDKFFINLRVNFDQNNQSRLGELFDLLQTEIRGDSRFRLAFHPVGRWGGENDADLAVCSDDESHRVTAEMKALAYQKGLGVTTLKDVNFLGGQVCYAARPFNLIVGASGKLMKCTVVLDKEPYNIVGQLGEDGNFVLDEEKMILWTEPAFARDSQCKRCVVLPSCQGISCPLPRITQAVRPCVTTRRGAKDELREVMSYPTRVARTREIA